MRPQLHILSAREVETIHQAALDILWRYGIKMPLATALEQLAAAGAEVGADAIVRLPAALVGQALERTPSRRQVVLHGRQSCFDVNFSDIRPRLAAMTMATHVVDPTSGEHRPATRADLASLTRLAHQLEHVAVNGGLVTPQDVPPELADWHTWAICLQHTSKHLTGGFAGSACVGDVLRMAAALSTPEQVRQRPFLSGWVLTTPPRTVDPSTLDALVAMARNRLPCMISSGPILGVTAPVTMAGAIAQAHAEILACIALAQAVNPGTPVVYTSFARGMDMLSGTVTMGSPEFAALKVAMAQMGRYLDLPVRMPGMLRDAKVLDAQAGFETGMVGLAAALGADLVDGMQLDCDLLVDFADPIFCNECMEALQRLARPLPVNDHSLALEAIAEVAPGGSFLEHPHTMANFREQLWHPSLFERRDRHRWQEAGAREMAMVARDKALAMLAAPPPLEISAAAATTIEEILQEAANRKAAG